MQLIRECGRYVGAISLLSLIYIALGWVTWFDHVMPVYYYRSVILLVFAMVLAFCGLVLLRHRQLLHFAFKDIVLSLCFGFLLNFSFLSLVTVSLDRSISVYLISYLAQHPEERFSAQDLETLFIKGYVQGHNAIARRIAEQMVTGSLVAHDDGTYSISKRGQTMVTQWRVIAHVFRVNNSFLYPQAVALHSSESRP
ncbi:MAG TPA: hypothetical protein H9898_02675 [Candidatus Anaerobiospirillum stercoravium]|nr:hypothetical protein [Candidatus Anaerobiospirillum stercoravium]